MRYFTRELWLDLQRLDQREKNAEDWRHANEQYQAQLKALEPRVSQDAYRFFTEADVHDGELLALVLEDSSRPPRNSPGPWEVRERHPVNVNLSVLDAYDKLVWNVSYKKLQRAVIDFPSDSPLFYSDGEGFGDWGYHELTDVGNGFLRHEVLFATGAVLPFEFKDIAVTCSPRAAARRGDLADS